MDDLVTRLQEAAARVSRHCFKQPGDSGLMSIPADPTRDVDLLLEAAATRLAEADALLLMTKWSVLCVAEDAYRAHRLDISDSQYALLNRIDAFRAADRMLDLTPVGPGETVDDALSRQKSPIWEREPPHCPTCDCPTAADRENERE